MEKNGSRQKRDTTGPSPDVVSSPPTPRQNRSIRAAHPAIYLNTRSHRLLRRAIRIWKIPIPIWNATASGKPKPISFQQRVEMLRNRPGASDSPKPMSRCVRDLQLRSSGSDSSPSPSGAPCRTRRDIPPRRRRRFRRQMQWYCLLSLHRRRRAQGQASPAGISGVKGCKDEEDKSPSPVMRVPSRKTSRRLWRRKLDSSSSENSPVEHKNTHRANIRKINRSSVSSSKREAKTELHLRDANSDLSKDAPPYSEKNINNQHSSHLKAAVQTNGNSAPRTAAPVSQEVRAESEEENSEALDLRVVSQAAAEVVRQPCGLSCRRSPWPEKWKSALLQRVLSSTPAPVQSAADSSTH